MTAILLFVLVPCIAHAKEPVPVRIADAIELRLTGVPGGKKVDGSYTVDSDGTINLPDLGRVKISGLLPDQIQKLIQNRYIEAKIYSHPIVSVQQNAVQRFVGVVDKEKNSRQMEPPQMEKFVDVAGGVKSPQRIPYAADLTLLTAITAAGGFTGSTRPRIIELMRGGRVTFYNLIDLEKNRGVNAGLLPGDKIIVSQGSL